MSGNDLNGARFVLLIVGHLANAPRPQKEAAALAALGANVTILGVWSSERLAKEDVQLAATMGIDYVPVFDLRIRNAANFVARLKFRLARELLIRLGVEGKHGLGLGVGSYLRRAKKLKPDLLIVHCEPGLWVGKKMLDAGFRVAVDFEDWFSRDLLESDRVGRPVKLMASLERHMLRHANVCYTTTKALAIAMARDAATQRVPAVVPNCFSASEREDAKSRKKDERATDAVSFHWFSQTIGPGRGLEMLAQALPKLKGNWELSLRGNLQNHRVWFDAIFSPEIQKRIRLLEPVSNADLLSRTMSHDVGLALESPYCESRALTATNKIFEYLRAGLAVIATDTPGQLEVLQECPDAGVVVSATDPSLLAAAMQAYIDDAELLAKSRAASNLAGSGLWDWERHRNILTATISHALTAPIP